MRTREVITVDTFTMADVFEALRARYVDIPTGATLSVVFVDAPERSPGAFRGESGKWKAPVVKVSSTAKVDPPGGPR